LVISVEHLTNAAACRMLVNTARFGEFLTSDSVHGQHQTTSYFFGSGAVLVALVDMGSFALFMLVKKQTTSNSFY
jgi:hypothetical protein